MKQMQLAGAVIGCVLLAVSMTAHNAAAQTPATGGDAKAAGSNVVSTADSASATNQIRTRWDGPVLVYELGEWKLRIDYLRKGTRSESQNGLLYKGANAIAPASKNASTNTPLGEMKWYGTQPRNLWDNTGWNFADPRRIKPSNLVTVTEVRP
jgi:hypothetical protein